MIAAVLEADFRIEVDTRAREWLDLHPSSEPRVVTYDVKRCCGGGRLCSVEVRALSRRDDPSTYATAAMDDGTRFLVDRRAAARLPGRFGLTVNGLGPFKHLDLDLDGEQWAVLLYDR